MTWLPLTAAIVAIVAAVTLVVVLGYAAYEIAWKARRLREDLSTLQGLNEQFGELRAGLAVAQQRIAAASAELR